MDYLWLRALHIAAVMMWIGGMLAAALTVAAASSAHRQQETADRSAFLESVRGWDRRVTAPAMLLVWALGLLLARNGGWFPQLWLLVKLALVLLLSALHGILSGNLRRLSRLEDSGTMAGLRYAPAAIILAVLLDRRSRRHQAILAFLRIGDALNYSGSLTPFKASDHSYPGKSRLRPLPIASRMHGRFP